MKDSVSDQSDIIQGFVELYVTKVSKKMVATKKAAELASSSEKSPALTLKKSTEKVSTSKISKTLQRKITKVLSKTVKPYCSTEDCSVCTRILSMCPITPCKHANPHQHGYFPHLSKRLAKRIHETNDFTVLLSINGIENPMKTDLTMVVTGPQISNADTEIVLSQKDYADVATQKTPPHVMECEVQCDTSCEQTSRGVGLDDVLAYAPIELIKDLEHAMFRAGRDETCEKIRKVVSHYQNTGKRFSTLGPSSKKVRRN